MSRLRYLDRCHVPIWVACALTLAPGVLDAQSREARVRVAEENFRKDPGGRKLATVLRGATFPVVRERGGWVEVELRGWIWTPSIEETDREGLDLVVSADGGENLRVEPQGRVVARLLEGFLLDRVTPGGQWTEVSRRGWLWKESLEISGPPSTAAASPATEADGDSEPLTVSGPLPVHARPDGDSVATLRAGAQAQVLGRAGDWLRVRVDGWVYAPAASDSAIRVADTGDLTPAQLRAEPARYRGALVRWRVQFIALRRAERARPDFTEGEPFLLARGPAGDSGFIYLAIPEELLSEAERLTALDYITIVGRVRTGRSSLVGSPVIDVTEMEIDRDAG